ncbi:uncharacterized protein TrAFT101_007938 [Trichoderma asperellum]|uniref:C2 domain-containing protein n=1 Tax=Trichoderma asperellum (strain ATCC 204424 / CBS 433.97 / NBRC 101777) TaxID=1042311 RepID=A0A2T3Z3A3_TRIA4|nr:hypothetical protein M441DRAFT_144609 [Trichoderma asperellum CBS 433.97]PTB39274.1 hypothetical protein M441DRAFT_144609 [Trichoderma asperellum CBS 433.97]UKZ93006.1 hypothetical protein TrAFT101_007938 [Trichoderma asperellum]
MPGDITTHHDDTSSSGSSDHEDEHKGPPGGYDKTPLPDAPQGYTLRFVFHSASNVPVADLHTASSDPFLVATLKGTQPKRHKEDPDLKYRTRTIHRTTTPEWNEEWIVANVPPGGFTLKCRMYDEDVADKDDRLGNVTINVDSVSEDWPGIPPPGQEFEAKKRVMSKRAFILKGIASAISHGTHLAPRLRISIQVLGKSEPPFAQMCTLAPTRWIKHNSPMIGRLIGAKVNTNESDDEKPNGEDNEPRSTKYDFQANEIQLQGPVPPTLYHRYVEFRPVIGSLFSSTGIRGTILNKALHKQHHRIYNYDSTTEYGTFKPCSREASLQFLRMVHFDEGGRVFTYVLTLDGLMRFTETGKEFGIDFLSKHTMHADAEKYIAYSGEFFIRRLQHPDANDSPEPKEKTHPSEPIPGGPPNQPPPPNPAFYQLYIDNESGTYRPEKSILPDLKEFLQKNFPDMGIVTMNVEDEHLQKLKDEQRAIKKSEGRMMHVVMNSSSDSLSSVESELNDENYSLEAGRRSKKEAAHAVLRHPNPEHFKEAAEVMLPHREKKVE